MSDLAVILCVTAFLATAGMLIAAAAFLLPWHYPAEVQPTEPWPKPPPPPDRGVVSMDAAWFEEYGDDPFVEVWMYWRIGRDGKPTASICDDPMGHPHVHRVRIPIPEDVQKCIAAVKDPPMCMVMNKFSKSEGTCPTTNESETPHAP